MKLLVSSAYNNYNCSLHIFDRLAWHLLPLFILIQQLWDFIVSDSFQLL